MPAHLRGRSRRPARVSLVILTIAASTAPARLGNAQGSVPQGPLGRGIPVYAPAPGAPERRAAPSFQEPTGQVSLREAVALALLHNPGLAAFAWETRAREAAILQAGRPPNPTLGVVAEDIGASGQTGTARLVQPQTTIQLSQVIELGGKRAARRQLAAVNRDLASWDYEAARIDVLTEVSRAFTGVLAAQETVALTDETTRLVEKVQQSVGARVLAGVVSPIEETRATVALAAVRVESARARRALEASRTRLALLWGSPTPAFTSVAGDLKAVPVPLPAIEGLMARLAESPALVRWAAEMAQRQAALALERSRRVPDVSVEAGYRRFRDIDSHALVIGTSLALPFFDRNRGGIEEARSRVAKAHEESRAVQGRVSAALADTYAALASAHDEVTALREAVLPGSRQTFDAVTEGYRLGKFGYLDVLDAQRTLVNAGSQYLRALADYHRAVADVERLIGAPLTPDPGTSPAPRE